MCQTVDLTKHSAGLEVHHFDGVGLEQLDLVGGTGEAEPMLQIAFDFTAVQRAEVMSDDQTLAERLVNAHVQMYSPFSQSDQQQANARF